MQHRYALRDTLERQRIAIQNTKLATSKACQISSIPSVCNLNNSVLRRSIHDCSAHQEISAFHQENTAQICISNRTMSDGCCHERSLAFPVVRSPPIGSPPHPCATGNTPVAHSTNRINRRSSQQLAFEDMYTISVNSPNRPPLQRRVSRTFESPTLALPGGTSTLPEDPGDALVADLELRFPQQSPLRQSALTEEIESVSAPKGTLRGAHEHYFSYFQEDFPENEEEIERETWKNVQNYGSVPVTILDDATSTVLQFSSTHPQYFEPGPISLPKSKEIASQPTREVRLEDGFDIA